MRLPIEGLAAEVLGLPSAERYRLLDRLIASLDADPAVEDAWMREAKQKRRRDRIRSRSSNSWWRCRGKAERRAEVKCLLHSEAAQDLPEIFAFHQKSATLRVAEEFLDEFDHVAKLLIANPGFARPLDLPRRV